MRYLALLLLIACGSVAPKYSGKPVTVTDRKLVAVNPDVKAFADADHPVFLVRGTYWLFDDGRWFQSDRPTGAAWTYVAKPPVPVRQIDQPFAFVHFKRGDGRGVETETVARGNVPEGRVEAPKPAQKPTAIDPSVDPMVN